MESSQLLEVTASVDADDCLRLELRGELDLWTSHDAEERLVAEQEGHDCVVIDLRGVTFMGAAGLGLLVRAGHRTTAAGQRLTVVNGPQLQRLMDLTDLGEMLAVVDRLN